MVWDLSLPVVEMIEDGRRHFMHRCYMEVVVLAAWTIWIHRNNSIFNGLQVSLARWKKEFRDLFILCRHRAKASLDHNMGAWLSSL
jgi:hypothetical protein